MPDVDRVETPEDLEGLPPGTIVRIGDRPGDIIVRDTPQGYGRDWLHAGDDRPSDIAEIREHWAARFPATILYRPDPTEEKP